MSHPQKGNSEMSYLKCWVFNSRWMKKSGFNQTQDNQHYSILSESAKQDPTDFSDSDSGSESEENSSSDDDIGKPWWIFVPHEKVTSAEHVCSALYWIISILIWLANIHFFVTESTKHQLDFYNSGGGWLNTSQIWFHADTVMFWYFDTFHVNESYRTDMSWHQPLEEKKN